MKTGANLRKSIFFLLIKQKFFLYLILLLASNIFFSLIPHFEVITPLVGSPPKSVAAAANSLAKEISTLNSSTRINWSELIPQIRQFVKTSMERMGVPGLALSIVDKDKIILCEGFGLRDVEKKLSVTAKTCFILGSTTKAFTTLAMALLVEEGKMSWDEPVRKYLPEFALKDEWATLRCTPRDLVTHRTGLPRHDLVWNGASFSPEEIVRVLAFLEPSRDFRTAYQYNNLMYIAAGVLISRVAGCSWEEFIKQRIFLPLGMISSGCSVAEYLISKEFSLAYRQEGEKLVAIAFPTPDQKIMYGPRASGSIFSNAEDMARWLLFHLNGGQVEGKSLISASRLQEMHSPQIVRPANPAEAPDIDHPSYGLGWMIDAYRGHYRVHHGGSTMGFSSYVAFFPREKFGIAILSNLNSNLPLIVCNYISDLVLGLKPIDWEKRLILPPVTASSTKQVAFIEIKSVRPLTEYAGLFFHPAYGEIRIVTEENKLFLIFRKEKVELQPQMPDLFRPREAHWRRYPVRFLSNHRGEIEAMAIPFEPAVKEIIFIKSQRNLDE